MNALKHIKILYIHDEGNHEDYGISELKSYCNNLIAVNDCLSGMKVYQEEKPQIVIYNVSLPKVTNEEFIQNIKKINDKVQVIITTDNLDTQKITNAIKFHLIKYLVYPFNANTMIDSIKECIRSIDSNTSNVLKLSDNLIYDKFNKTLLKDKTIVSLSKKEAMFFDALIMNKDRAISYEEFNHRIWGGDMTKDALRSIVKDLRKKIDKNIIKNVSGIGYRVNL